VRISVEQTHAMCNVYCELLYFFVCIEMFGCTDIKRINRELYGRSIICHVKVSEDYPLNFDLWRFHYTTRFVPAQGLELAGKPYAWIKRIPNSSCARLSAGIARPVTWKKKKEKKIFFYFIIYFFFLTRLCCCAHLGKVQANALTFYCAIYDQTCGCVRAVLPPKLSASI
jgi:hypothetical protein